MKRKLEVYPRVDGRLLDGYRRLSDVLGLMAFYPVLAVVAVGIGDPFFYMVAETYILVIGAALAYRIYRLEAGRGRVAAVIMAVSLLLIISPYLGPITGLPVSPFIGAAGKVILLSTAGLHIHSIAKSLGRWEKLDKYGGLIVLGSLVVIVREPLVVALGLLLAALGFGGASTEIRKLYYANLRVRS